MKEVILAAYIEKMYDKNEILELYLNKVYFGRRPVRRRGRIARVFREVVARPDGR